MELSVTIQAKVEVTPSNWNFGFQPTCKMDAPMKNRRRKFPDGFLFPYSIRFSMNGFVYSSGKIPFSAG